MHSGARPGNQRERPISLKILGLGGQGVKLQAAIVARESLHLATRSRSNPARFDVNRSIGNPWETNLRPKSNLLRIRIGAGRYPRDTSSSKRIRILPRLLDSKGLL